MTKNARLDRRPCLYGEPRLTDTQVRTLLALSRLTTPRPGKSPTFMNTAFIRRLGGNPRSLASLSREGLVRKDEDGFWQITPKGVELLDDIRQHLDKEELA